MAAAVDEFGIWLSDKLKALNTDEGVFGSYISGILDGDDSGEEKKEALESILSDIIENDISRHVSEIMDKWEACRPVVADVGATNVIDVEDRLVKLLGSQTLATAAPKQYTDEEKKIRQAILSQYSELSDDEEAVAVTTEGDGDLVRNTNASTVAAAARERREQAKQDSIRKKEKDKEDREKQKQLKEDKKEKRKTSKNERKR